MDGSSTTGVPPPGPVQRVGSRLVYDGVTSRPMPHRMGHGLGDPVVATALLDRLLHHAVDVQIEGSSYRLPGPESFADRPELAAQLGTHRGNQSFNISGNCRQDDFPIAIDGGLTGGQMHFPLSAVHNN